MVPVAYLPYFFNPTLNIKMVFGEKIPKMGTFSDFFTIFFVKMLQQNLIISLPTYPKFCWYATGTTHIFHLGLSKDKCVLFCLCCVAVLKSLPALSFNALIIPILRIACTITFHYYFFCGSFMLFMSCLFHAFASVHCCLVVTCWERADLFAFVCDV